MFLQENRRVPFPRRNCVLFWDRRNPIFFLGFANIRESTIIIYLKYSLNEFFRFFHRELVSRELENFSVFWRAEKTIVRFVRLVRSFSSTCKRNDVSHISKITSRLWNFWKLPLSSVRQNTDFTPASLVFTRTTACTGLQERINSEMEASASCCRAKYQRLSLFIRNPPPCGASVSQPSILITVIAVDKGKSVENGAANALVRLFRAKWSKRENWNKFERKIGENLYKILYFRLETLFSRIMLHKFCASRLIIKFTKLFL